MRYLALVVTGWLLGLLVAGVTVKLRAVELASCKLRYELLARDVLDLNTSLTRGGNHGDTSRYQEGYASTPTTGGN